MRSRLNALPIVLTTLLVLAFLPGLNTDTAIGSTGIDKYVNRQSGEDRAQEDPVVPLSFVPGQLVVGMYQQTSAGDVLANEFVLQVEQSLAHSNCLLVSLQPGADPETAAAALASQTSVSFAHPNYVLNALHPVQGSFPFSDEQQIGSFEDQKAAVMMDLAAAHAIATGNLTAVAVIDGGIDFDHPALEGKAVSGWDFVDEDALAFDETGGRSSGHGTFVAGIVHLVAPDASIRAYRIMDASGNGDGFSLARAIEQAVDDGCDVINLSVVLTQRHQAVREAIDYAASQGVLVVAAAGNNGSNVQVYPAAETNAVAVAAIDTSFQVADFSNYGPFVDVCAPGVGTYSAFQGDLFAWWSGTSFAAPFVAGQAALMREVHPNLLTAQIKSMIMDHSLDLDSLNPDFAGFLGAGMILPEAALGSTSVTDTATIIPDTVSFTHHEGTVNIIAPQKTVVLLSSNAPAAYTAQVLDSTDMFVSVIPQTGVTNDSLLIVIDPYAFSQGVYQNTVLFSVDGISTPVILHVALTVLPPEEPGDYAYFQPSSLWFTAPAGAQSVLYGGAVLISSNAPAAFYGEVVLGGGQFLSLVDSIGITNDTVRVAVDPTQVPGVGVYADTVLCHIDGIADAVKLPVVLEISDSTGGAGDQAYVWPAMQSFSVPSDSDIVLVGGVAIWADGGPKWWSAGLLDTPDFVVLGDTVGQTGDSLLFTVVSSSLLSPGTYADTIAIYVSGVTNSPLISVVLLTVGDSSGTEVAVVTPPAWTFTLPIGSSPFEFCSWLSSTNAPAAYQVETGFSSFVTYLDSLGNTNDSVCLYIDPSGLAPGMYCDTVVYHVTGVPFSLAQSICVYVDSLGDTTSGNPVQLTPSSLTFYAAEGSTAGQTGCALLFVPFENPLPYSGQLLGGGQFAALLNPSGLAPDSVCVEIDPTGLPAGVYRDSAMFLVENYPDPVVLTLALYVTGSDTLPAKSAGTLLQNYPNPFNPVTTISFSLPEAGRASLEVFDVSGRRVAVLVDGDLEAGDHTVSWDASRFASGIYLYRLSVGGAAQTKKMLLLK